MPVQNSVFGSKDFWELYLFLESSALSDEEVEKQLELLKNDFPVREDLIEFEYQNKKYAEPNRTVEFYFDCGGEFALLLEYDPDPNGCDQTLSLVEKAGNEKHQLGWWDLARWHPFCLKPDEFETLLQYWDRFDPRWTQSPVPRLLLFNFVGIEDSETVEALAAAAGSALERLGVRELSNDPAVALRNFLENEGGYEWKFDERRGWLFASGEYDCYSLRNECHAGGEEGTFPFEKYGQLIAAVKTALKNY